MFSYIRRVIISIQLREDKFKRFGVVSRFNNELIRICKSIRGHEWDPETKTWFLPKDFYHKFKGKIPFSKISVHQRVLFQQTKN